MDICIRGDDSPPLLRYISAFTKPPSCCCRGTESASTDAKTFRFVLSVSSIPFFSFAVYSIWVCIYIYEIVCVATFARREGEKGNLYLDPTSRARRVFSALCGGFVALTPRGGERCCFFDIRFVCHRDDQFEQKLCKIYPAYHPLFILRRNDTK